MIFNMGGVENVKSKMPEFTYSGTYQLIDDGKNGSTQNWRIKFLTSGTLKFTKVVDAIDIFCVGGGAGGARDGGAGGGGGYTKTVKKVAVDKSSSYVVTIGAGGHEWSGAGGASSFANGATTLCSANGGASDGLHEGGSGGSGGGGAGHLSADEEWEGAIPEAAGNGGSNGNNGGAGYYGSGAGQGTTTREFGESSGTLYAGGGAGGPTYGTYGGFAYGGAGGGGGDGTAAATDGTANTGGGGAGRGGAGGSGIVVIRNAR